jgi:uncharacterized protein YndB with AHSA1/START domain
MAVSTARNNSAATSPQQSTDEFVLTRTFDAPRDLVWKAFTEPERLAQWFGPKGCGNLTHCAVDLRPGGVFHYCMRLPGGKDMWGKWTFREITPPERMVCIVSFSDENGGITRHPFSPDWPLETLSDTTFTEADGKTTITLHWSAYDATEKERETFNNGHAGMSQGWNGAMDQLVDYLAGAR